MKPRYLDSYQAGDSFPGCRPSRSNGPRCPVAPASLAGHFTAGVESVRPWHQNRARLSKILSKRLLLACGVAIPLNERTLRAMKKDRIDRFRDGEQGACLGVDCALATLHSLPPSFVTRHGDPHARHRQVLDRDSKE